MFSVENADFIAEKLASELLPDQEYREVAKNAEEAIQRRIARDGLHDGRIEFDVDWALHEQTGGWYISCADNGDGMTRSELQRYMTTLAVIGAGANQTLQGNQGMGLKISGPTRHKNGVLIRSMKDGERTMVQVGWTGVEYDLIPIGPEGEVIVGVAEEMFPHFIREKGSGTVVTFLGNAEDDNTFVPAGRARGWLFKYMHQRFFRQSSDGVELLVRVPSGDEQDWPQTIEEATARSRGDGGRSFNLSKVYGTAGIWDDAADRQGTGNRGCVELDGDAAADVPSARIHWWVLPPSSQGGTDVSSRTNSGGSVAILFQNELHDWRVGNAANPFFARLGVIFGKPRVAFVLEPLGGTITSDFARAHVLVGGKPAFESDSWLVWSEQFRERTPEAIRQVMSEEQSRLQAEDPDRARRIRDRLKDVMSLLRPRRFRPTSAGQSHATRETTGPGSGAGSSVERVPGPGRRKPSVTRRGIGAALTQVDPDGEPADEIYAILDLDPRWVTEIEAEGMAIVGGNGNGIRDRAAALAGEDGATAPVLLLNQDFRGFQTIVAAVNDWANSEGDDSKAAAIESAAKEWVEQKMVEAVNGLRQLENGSSWLPSHFDEALSPVALTAAFMADRYHTLREVKRAAGALRQAASA